MAMFRRFSYFLAFGFIMFLTPVEAQTNGSQQPTDTIKWSQYSQKAAIFSQASQADSALHYYRLALLSYPPDSTSYLDTKGQLANLLKLSGQLQKAISVYQEIIDAPAVWLHEDKDFIIRVYQNLSVVYSYLGDYEGGIATCRTGLRLVDSLGLPPSDAVANLYSSIGVNYGYLSIYDDAIKYLEKGLAIDQQLDKLDEQNIATSYNNLGVINKWLGNLEKADYYYEMSKEIRLRVLGKNHPELADIYGNIGTLSTDRGTLERALQYHTRAMEIREKHPDGEIYKLAGIYNNIAWVHIFMEDLKKAQTFAQRSIDLYAIEGIASHPTRAEKYTTLATIYRKRNLLDSAIEQFKISNALIEKQFSQQDRIHVSNLIAIGEIYRTLGKPDEAKVHLEQALKAGRALFGDQHHAVAQALRNLAWLSIDSNQLDQAADYIQKAHKAVTTKEDVNSADDPMAGIRVISTVEYMEVIKCRIAIAARRLNKDPQDKAIRKQLISTLKEGDHIIDQLSRRFHRPQDRFLFQKQVSSYYNNAVAHCYTMHQHSQGTEMIDLALFFMEKSRFNVFMFQSLDQNFYQFDQIPDSLIALEKDLKISIGYYESKVIEQLAAASMDSARYHRYQNKLFELTEQYQILTDQFAKDYSAYFNLRYQSRMSNLEDVQKFLQEKNAAMVSYFMDSTQLYTICLSADEAIFTQVKCGIKLTDKIDRFIFQLHQPGFEEAAIRDMRQTGWELQQILFEAIPATATRERLIVVPSGKLAMIPFEALSLKNQEGAYRYFIEDHVISYANSASALLLNHLQADHMTDPGVLAVAPFNENKGETPASALQWTKKEVEAIARYFPTEKLMAQEASESNFRDQAMAYPIIHLASHGELDDVNPMHSRLIMTKQDEQNHDGAIHVGELYGLHLPSELVVLSACDTGAGKILAGEGAVSLAKGFFYAGAKTVVMSLWKANDKSSYAVMDRFYQYLANEDDKDRSLRNSKLEYLKKAKGFEAHPHFWAQFVINGDTNSINKSTTSPWSVWLLLVLAAGTIGMIGLKAVLKRKS